MFQVSLSHTFRLESGKEVARTEQVCGLVIWHYPLDAHRAVAGMSLNNAEAAELEAKYQEWVKAPVK